MSESEPWSFEQITEPLVAAFRHAYKLERQNQDVDTPWPQLAPNIDSRQRATTHGIKDRLSAEMLRYSEEEQGREAIVELVGAAVALGITQGLRIAAQDHRERARFDELLERLDG